MARNRMIRPEFWEDSKLAKISRDARLFFVALWNFADDEGYIEYDMAWLKTKCFPYDDIDVNIYIKELESMSRIEIQNNIIHIANFLKHQKIDKPKMSDLKNIYFNNSQISSDQSATSSDLSTTKEKLKEVKRSEVYAEFENSVLSKWNSFCKKYPKLSEIQKISNTRRKHLKERFADSEFKDFDKILQAIEKQPFLINGNSNSRDHKDWHIDFDWIIKNDTNYIKVLELKYMKKGGNPW